MSEQGIDSFDAIERNLSRNATIVKPIDAFGRVRVSQINTLLDIKQLADKQVLLVSEETSGGTSVHSTTNSSTTMATTADAEFVVRQAFQRPPYFSGKSHQFFNSFSNFAPETNITKRVGYYSSTTSTPFNGTFDGIYLESASGVVTAKITKSGTDSLSVDQDSWNIDGFGDAGNTLNPSGVTIDWTKSQVFTCEFEWLGAGVVIFSLLIGGVPIPFHLYQHANAFVSTYMTCPNQPLRWEIRQSGAGSGDFEMICGSVGTEGSITRLGKNFSLNTGGDANHVNANTLSTKYALFGIRLKAAQVNARVDIGALEFFAQTDTSFLWELWWNPSVAGTFTYVNKTNSAVQIVLGSTADPSTNTVTGGTLLDSGYILGLKSGGKKGGAGTAQIENNLHLGSAIDGTLDEIVLSVEPLVINADIFGSIGWNEID